jgi:hypothetical protein
LLQLSQQDHILLVTLHHIICDGCSLGVLVRELAVLYDTLAAGEPSPLPALSIQYADFASWQNQWQRHAVMQTQLAYWKEQLRGPLPVLELPTARPRGTGSLLRTARQTFELPQALFKALKDLSQCEGNTLFMTCLAAFKIFLYGYTGQTDLCVATLVANRTPETEDLIGLLVNTVLLRTDLSGNPTQQEVLQRVRATTLAAFANQGLPFEEVVRALEHERGLERTTLCQAMVIWQNAMVQTEQFLQRRLRFETIEQNVEVLDAVLTTFDVILTLRERSQGLTGMLIYKTDLFDAETICQMLDDFQYVLTCLHTQPETALAAFYSLRKMCC